MTNMKNKIEAIYIQRYIFATFLSSKQMLIQMQIKVEDQFLQRFNIIFRHSCFF